MRSQREPDPNIEEGWDHYLERVNQPHFPIVASTVDPLTGDTWIATWGGGLVRYSAGRFDVFNQLNSGVAGDLVFDVAVADGRVFAATIGGISAFETTPPSWSLYFARRAQGSPEVWTDLVIREGVLHATSSRGDVRRYDAEKDRWMDGESVDPPRPTEALLATTGVPDAGASGYAMAVYGPRNRTIQLPGSPSQPARDPARCDLAAIEIAMMTIHKERNTGGHRIELVRVPPGYSRYGWTLPEEDVAILALHPQVGGVLGYLAPRAQPILNEVVAWTGIGYVSTASLDDADREALFENPFAFRCYGAEKQRHRMLFDHLFSLNGVSRLAIVRSGLSFDDLRAGWWKDYARRRGVEIVWNELWRGGVPPPPLAAQRPDVVLAWRDVESTVRLIQQLRVDGLDCPIVVSPACVRDDIGSLADSPLGSLVAMDESPNSYPPLVPSVQAQLRRAQTPQRVIANTAERDALASFDGADHLLSAMAQANGDPRMVVQVLTQMRDSAFGEAHFENKHGRPVVSVARCEGGSWVHLKTKTE